MLKAVENLPVVDFATKAYRTQPFPILADYARQWRVARSTRGVEIFDYDLCRASIVDSRLGTGHPKLMEVLGLPDGSALDYKRKSISFYNRGETRRKLRRPIVRLLGEGASEEFRQDIRRIVSQAIDAVAIDRPVDLIAEFCDRIPSSLYCKWVNAPESDWKFVAKTSHVVQQVHTRDSSHTDDIVEGFEKLLSYIDERIESRRGDLGDDLISDLIRETHAGNLTHDEVRTWLVKLAEANTDNSSHQIAIAVIELASRPDVWDRLAKDPSLAPAAIREVMRFHPRSISTSREALVDMDMAGYAVPAGTPVFANFGAAHWNSRRYPKPEWFNIDRPVRPLHLNFGGGVFSCVGRFVVTIEVEETVAMLAKEFPGLRLEKANFDHSPMFTSVTDLIATLKPN
ncbi:MAG: cytochrome P450 [Albidovulum sp.]|nr:cytochrome P450 [Albidovulum sp.]